MKRQSIAATALVVIMLLTTVVVPQRAAAQAGCQDRYEPNDDQPRQLEPGQIQATICPKDDVDIFTFGVSDGDNVYLSLTNLPADYDLALYSDNKADWVGTSDNSHTANEEIRWTADRNDVLYIVIYGYNGATSTRPYSLTLKRFPKVNLDSKNANPSAQLTADARRKLQTHLTTEGYENLMAAAQFMTDAVPCLTGIAELLASQGAYLPPGTSEACAGAIVQINEVLQKHYKP